MGLVGIIGVPRGSVWRRRSLEVIAGQEEIVAAQGLGELIREVLWRGGELKGKCENRTV